MLPHIPPYYKRLAERTQKEYYEPNFTKI